MIGFDDSRIIRLAAGPLKVEVPLRELYRQIAIHPDDFDNMELFDALLRYFGKVFPAFVGKMIPILMKEVDERGEEKPGTAFLLARAYRDLEKKPLTEIMQTMNAACPELLREALLQYISICREKLAESTSRKEREQAALESGVLQPEDYMTSDTVHWLLEGDKENLENALKRMGLLRDFGYIEEMPEWQGHEPAPPLKVVGIIPKTVQM